MKKEFDFSPLMLFYLSTVVVTWDKGMVYEQ